MSDRRLEHGNSFGKKWMQTSELEMMIAVLLRDGRYGNQVCVIPFHIMQVIKECLKLFKLCWRVANCRKKAEAAARRRGPELANSMFEELEKKSPKAAKEKRQEFIECHVLDSVAAAMRAEHPQVIEADLTKIYDKQQQRVVDEFLGLRPGCVLDTQIIVFPLNFANQHWGATFVFHAGAIRSCDEGSHVPCFFRYCSKDPHGTRRDRKSVV